MKARQLIQANRRKERGFVLAAAAIALAAIFAIMVVAIDIGRISHTGTELQGIADSAAVSGAMAILKQGPGTDPSPAAVTAAGDNRYDGQTFSNGSHGQLTTTAGNWNTTNTPPFTGGGTPTNAVQAFVTGPNVPLILAALIPGASSTKDIQRQAVAVIAPPSNAIATMPFSVCSDVSNGVSPQPPGPCPNGDGTVIKTLPDLVQQGAQNSCFTGLGGGACASCEQSLLPASCGGNPQNAAVGQIISLDNGQQNSVLKAIQNCVGPAQGGNANNTHLFILPVIANCNCSGTSQPIQGFVEIEIDSPSQITNSCAGQPPGAKCIVGAKQICDSSLTSDGISIGGAGDFGVKEVRLVQ